MEILTKAEQLKNELDDLRPLDGEREARIMQKFRLDWNYHSNNLEGNSLTYGETKALILFGITAQGKPLKDHFEITGHNEAINWILEIVRGETVLTESFIRQLHTLLLKETSYKEALTPDGKPTRRKIEVGKYKTQPNHVLTITGETFYFATPEETPAKMHDLIEWFRKEKEKADVNPIILAARFHYRFIRIHPFDDGNGRVARILMNFILMQFGYPPVIIKTEDKEDYYAVLRLADADELETFIEYIAQNLVRSLEIMIKGAKGESIEEPDDLDKELALLEREIRSIGTNISVSRSKDSLIKVFENSIFPLMSSFFEKCKKFDRFYQSSVFGINYFSYQENTGNVNFNEIFARVLRSIEGYDYKELDTNQINGEIFYTFTSFLQNGFGKFSLISRINLIFEVNSYSLFSPDKTTVKKYSEYLEPVEIEEICKSIVVEHKEFIEQKIKEITQPLP